MFLIKLRLPDITELIKHYLLQLVTFTYYGALQHYTLLPMDDIVRHQHDTPQLRQLLFEFKKIKKMELDFVKKAAALSAAAVIGVFSWPDVGSSFWLARLFWNCSLWLSIFALISSAQSRLLEEFPESDQASLAEIEVWRLLRFMLKPSTSSTAKTGLVDVEHANTEGEIPPKSLGPNLWLIWLWQSPTMLMSFSWLFFLIGYEVYLLTPLIEWSSWSGECTIAVVATVVGALAAANFFITTYTARWALEIDTIIIRTTPTESKNLLPDCGTSHNGRAGS
ncbi:hypothetical protein BGZ57DRAFT_935655 [Hyaloscypha finlandica]|nr:hypothetical protein BGZ57DRAFT_935655 [Hyaloscypha finlandica]